MRGYAGCQFAYEKVCKSKRQGAAVGVETKKFHYVWQQELLVSKKQGFLRSPSMCGMKVFIDVRRRLCATSLKQLGPSKLPQAALLRIVRGM